MNHRTFWSGSVASFLLVSACSPPPGDAPQPIDAGDDGPCDYPPLPDDCDMTVPVLSTGSGWRFIDRVRIVDGTVYAPGDDGIVAIPVSGGAPVSVIPYPTLPTRRDAASEAMEFRDFWIEHDSIVGVLAETLFTAPLTGGPPALVPGYSLPWVEDTINGYEPYMRAGPYVYSLSRLFAGGLGIRRHALAGGPPSDFLTFNDPSRHQQFLVACGDSLHYVDGAAPGSTQAAIFVTPLHEAKPTIIPAELRAPSVVGCDDRNLYVLEGKGFNPTELWRLTDGRWTKLKLPLDAFVYRVPDIRYVSHQGVSYFTGFAVYRLPDDRREGRRDVVFRAHADSDTVEIARCVPEAAIDPTAPRSELTTEILDLAVHGDTVYAVASTFHAQKGSWKDYLVQVSP